MEPHVHAVSVYAHDQEVVDELARFIADGILQEGRAVVVATPEHRTALVETLRGMGLDPDQPPVAGHLVLLDAKQTLQSFTTPSGFDRSRFHTRVGQVVIDAGADGKPVRVFGEMVGLLWELGDVQGAITLEAMWNDLIPQVGFDLMCAYPAALIETSSLVDVRAVCDQHTSVRAPEQQHTALDSDHAESSRLFLPVSESARASRNFVAAQLRRLGADDLVHDANVIVSELATNAVRHARSPFRVSVSEVGDLVCISVKDVGEGHATLPTAAADDALEGRGMAIIDALAHRWGYSALDHGKVVWAQLAS